MKSSQAQIRAASSALLVALTALPAAHAADILWSGATTGTLDWNTATNWTGNVTLNSTTDRADLRLDWGTTPIINLSAPATTNGILFDDTGATGDSSLTIGNGGNATNTLTLGGTSPTISVSSTTVTISADLVGTSGFSKTNGGALVISGNNTSFSGLVVASAGTLRIGSSSALNSGSTVQLNSGAALNVNNSSTIAGLNDNAGSGGSVNNSSGGGKVLTVAGSGTYSFSGNFTGNTTNTKVGLAHSGTGTQNIGGNNTANIGYQSVTGGGTLVFAKQNSIFQGLTTGAVVNANATANAGISVSANGTVALGVGDSVSGYFDAAAIGTFLDATHMGNSTNSQGFRSNSLLGFDTTNATGGTFTYSGNLTNLGTSTGIGFAKLGSGTLILDGTNTYGGVTQVRAGTLQVGNGAAAGSLPTGTVTISSGATLAYSRNDTISVSNIITGAGGFTQSGSGQTNLTSNSNDFSGPVSITNGVLQVNSLGNGTVTLSSAAKQYKFNRAATYSNAITINGATGVANQGVLDTSTSINATISGPIAINATPTNGGHFGSSSTGSLTVNGAITSSVPVIFRRGVGIFSGGGNYSIFQVRADTAKIGANNGLSTNATVAIGGDGAATFDLNGFNQTLVGISKGANAATITNNGAANSTLTTTGTSTYAGLLSDGVNKLGLTVSGGSLTLSGNNTYTGATSVSAGILRVNGSLANTAVGVAPGASLGGNGTIAGAVTVDSGAFLAPGNSPGTLTLSNGLTLNGTYTWELASLTTSGAGTNYDQIALTGGDAVFNNAIFAPSFGAGLSPEVSSDTFWASNQSWVIVDNTGLGSISGTFAAIDNSLWASKGAFSITLGSGAGGDVTLAWTAIPEPSSLALLLGAGAGLLAAGRRRRRS